MTIELPNLPYAYEALEPLISAATLRTHHGKHHRGYVDRLNALIQNTDLADSSLETIVKLSARRGTADPVTVAVFNNAAQAWNHAFYWRSLQPLGGGVKQGAFAALIASEFGSYRGFAEAFKAAATSHFGSGWAWLVLDDGALKIVTTSNADTPIVQGQTPLLVIDVWEHAYYLDHQERRTAYVTGVVDHLLNWEFAERNFAQSNGCRADEVIYVSGHCLDTARIETALVAHPAVVEAAVVGYPHPIKGQGVHAYVTLRANARPSDHLRRELRQWTSKEVDPLAAPDRIQWTSTLPKNRVGQLVRRILRRIAANDVSHLGDTTMLADPAVIDELISGRPDRAVAVE